MKNLFPSEKTAGVQTPPYEEDLRGSATEPVVGELVPGEAEAGGLGRHLGLWSTTFLMYVLLFSYSSSWAQDRLTMTKYWTHHWDWYLLNAFVYYRKRRQRRRCLHAMDPRGSIILRWSRDLAGAWLYDPALWRRESLP
jgi:hypothetical protein